MNGRMKGSVQSIDCATSYTSVHPFIRNAATSMYLNFESGAASRTITFLQCARKFNYCPWVCVPFQSTRWFGRHLRARWCVCSSRAPWIIEKIKRSRTRTKYDSVELAAGINLMPDSLNERVTDWRARWWGEQSLEYFAWFW